MNTPELKLLRTVQVPPPKKTIALGIELTSRGRLQVLASSSRCIQSRQTVSVRCHRQAVLFKHQPDSFVHTMDSPMAAMKT